MKALTAWCEELERGGDRVSAARVAAETVAGDPWRVVEQAGPLARARPARAETDLALTRTGAVCRPESRHAWHKVRAGQLYPAFDTAGRRRRGAFDTPRDFARVVAAQTLAVAPDAVSALDPACGTGALLVGMHDAGVRRLVGWDLDAAALAVASVALPHASLTQQDGLQAEADVDVVVSNPPFVPPERQGKEHRARLQEQFPWLHGRFDLSVPFASHCTKLARRAASLLIPASLLSQPYAESWRRRVLKRHRITAVHGPARFPGVSVDVVVLTLQPGAGAAPLPWGVSSCALLELPTAPIDPGLKPGDVAIWHQVHGRSRPLGALCEVDTGLVAHSKHGPKARLLHEEPGPGRVPFADAREFFSGTHRWLDYGPQVPMHRAKRPALFEGPKLVLQRLRGNRPLRVAVDRQGLYVGHTCIVARPLQPDVDLDALVDWLRSDLLDGLLRIGHGPRLDLYPRVLRQIPVANDLRETPESAWGLDAIQCGRLRELARR